MREQSISRYCLPNDFYCSREFAKREFVLKCLETLVEHEPRVNEITSQSTIVLRFEFIIKNCGNNTGEFLLSQAFII